MGRDSNGGERRRRRVRRTEAPEPESRSGRKRVILGGVVAFTLVAGLGAAWLATNAVSARSDLETTRDAAVRARTALLEGDTTSARSAASEAVDAATDARNSTNSPVWRIAEAIPYLGSPLKTVSDITDVIHGLAANVLEPAVNAGASLAPNQLIQGGRIDVQPLIDARPVLATTSVAAQNLNTRAQGIAEPAYGRGVIGDALTQLRDQTHELSGLLTNTEITSRVLPPMIGAEGPRSYFLAFQTNAEARGTGGLLGGFGIVNADNGLVTVPTVESNQDLPFDAAPIGIDPQYDALWAPRNTTSDFRNANASPDFPTAARIWTSMWQGVSGQQVDGAIATDPVALSYILGATGPITLPDGEVISAENVVETTLATSYARFGDDTNGRKNYLVGIAAAVVTAMSSPGNSPQELAEAVGRAAAEGRLSVWSAHPAEQEILAATKIGHVLPADPSPYAGVVVNNAGGNKLDYYLDRSITYSGGDCAGASRTTTITVSLTNNAPAEGLPPYVANTFRRDVPYATNESIVYLYATVGSTFRGVTVNGMSAFGIQNGLEKGHPVQGVYVTTRPGETQTVVWEVEEPTSSGIPLLPVQPLVDDAQATIELPTCG